ncbi:AraC family transcriptional regulator [Terribacillus saccharophilus]|uniref:AraC family transcriptional regulator n=1 Tax=Terribacillus saccharophilus TaxID=361277 RepID=UPI000BA54AAE|nr:AraC family transcriptional regulator [Terribacillus saccharophilus]PAF38833.1 AraC family transcriptional regulator [Terribacillus saccharophilus]
MTAHSIDRIKFPTAWWALLRQLEIEPFDVLRKAQLPLSILTEPAEVTTANYFSIWQAISELLGDPATGTIKLTTTSVPAQWSPSLLAPYHARNYRDALLRMSRYKQLCSPERLQIAEEGETCTIQIGWPYLEQPAPPLLVYITMVTLLELGQQGTGHRLNARLVELTHPIPAGKVEALKEFFGCEMKFGAPYNRLTLNSSDLDRPFRSYNAELLEILIPALEDSLNKQLHNNSITKSVKWIVKKNLSAGRPDIHSIANELGMSDRTLQRRLTEEGTSFKQLLTESRREQARTFLSDPSLDIKEVAFLLGYEDQNSFYRAFRLWEGDTPSNWRSRATDEFYNTSN